MFHAQFDKVLATLPTAAVGATATSTLTIDRLGFDHVSVSALRASNASTRSPGSQTARWPFESSNPEDRSNSMRIQERAAEHRRAVLSRVAPLQCPVDMRAWIPVRSA